MLSITTFLLSKEIAMSSKQPMTVKVSSRNQIAVPAAARARLNIEAGDQLLVDIQDGMLILIPRPEKLSRALAGLHRELWKGLDAAQYLDEERDSWEDSSKN
jgi:AbrB family looped-hinge helix DNA binding protein